MEQNNPQDKDKQNQAKRPGQSSGWTGQPHSEPSGQQGAPQGQSHQKPGPAQPNEKRQTPPSGDGQRDQVAQGGRNSQQGSGAQGPASGRV